MEELPGHSSLLLWGLAVEQDMDYLRLGSDVWYELCELAADLYSYERSARVLRLCALLRAVPAEQSDAPNRQRTRDAVERERSQAIVEIG